MLRAMVSNPDVAIIGGGPAGSVAAILLARAGRRVVLCEKETFPRFKIGESLLPHSLELFDKLGVRDELDRHAFPKYGGEIATGCGRRMQRFYFENALQLSHRSAYQVERAWFDKMLLDRATASGVEVRQPCTVSGVGFDKTGVTLRTDSGEIRASYLLDCSGRNAVVGSHFDLKRRYEHLQKFSVFAHFEGVQRDEGRDATLTRLVSRKGAWFWLIPIDERRTSVGVVMDTAGFRASRLTPQAALEDAIATTPLMRSRMATARRITDVHAIGDYSYRNTRLHGSRWLLAGDAAGFIDPIFSTGVFLALHSGEKAAAVLDFALRHPALGRLRMASYARAVNRLMNRYLRFANSWYTDEFVDVFTTPKPPLQIPQAVNSVLGGNINPRFGVWWRLQLFYLVLWIQKRHALVPRLEDLKDEAAPEMAVIN
jgi:flavin-dependent dehydrogenase